MRSLAGIKEAITLESLSEGSNGSRGSPGTYILRRGILIAALIALETFIRDRTTEALRVLERWPKSYEDLPERLRIASRLNALSHLQQFAKVLKRQDEDYEAELRVEIAKMASGHNSVQQFTKYVAGDYTGNLSDTNLKDLLSILQVHDCWNTFRHFSSEAGIGVPSVQELVKSTVRKRHRSAHSASYMPSATDIIGLETDLLCVAMCFDVAVSSSMEQSLSSPDIWAAGKTVWRTGLFLYIAQPQAGGFRVLRSGRSKAFRLVKNIAEARTRIPRAGPGSIAVLVEQNRSGKPMNWDLL